MATLGEAVVEVTADTSRLRADIRAGLQDVARSLIPGFGRIGRDAGGELANGVNRGAVDVRPTIGTFGQLNFTLAKTGVAAVGLLAAISPVEGALVGLAAAAVSVTGALASAATGGMALFGNIAISAVAGVKLMTLAVYGLGASFKALVDGDMKAFDASLKKLPPSTRAFMIAIKGVSGEWGHLRRVFQNQIFSGLSRDVKGVSNNLLSALTPALKNTATIFHKAAAGVADWLSSAKATKVISAVFYDINQNMRRLLPAAANVGKGLINLFLGSHGASKQLAGSILGISREFRKWTREVTKSGDFQKFLSSSLGTLRTLGGIVKNVGSIFVSIFGGQATKAGDGLLKSFEKVTGKVADFFKSVKGQSALSGFIGEISKVGQVASALGTTLIPVIGAAAKAFSPLMSVVDNIRTALLPIVQDMAKKISGAFKDASPQIKRIAGLLNQLVPILKPVVKFLAGIFVSSLIGAFKGALNVIEGVLKVIIGVVNLFKNVFTGNWKGAWDSVKQIASGAWEAIKGAIQVFLNVGILKAFRVGLALLRGIFTGGFAVIRVIPGRVLGYIVNGVRSFGGDIKLAFQYAVRAGVTPFRAGLSVLRDAAGLIFRGLIRDWRFLTGAFAAGVAVVVSAFHGIESAARFMWNSVLKPTFKFIVDAFLSLATSIVEGADKAFGWIPGLGDKLDAAVVAMKKFKEDINAQIDGVHKDITVKVHVPYALPKGPTLFGPGGILTPTPKGKNQPPPLLAKPPATNPLKLPTQRVGVPAPAQQSVLGPTNHGVVIQNQTVVAHDYRDYVTQTQKRKRRHEIGGVF